MPSEDIDKTSERIYFVTGALGTGATPLGSGNQDLTELVVQAAASNAVTILIGDANSQGWELEPGREFQCPVKNPALLFGRVASGTGTYAMFGRFGN